MRQLMPIPKGRAARNAWARNALAWTLNEYVYATVPLADQPPPGLCVTMHHALVPVAWRWSALRSLLQPMLEPTTVAALETARAEVRAILGRMVPGGGAVVELLRPDLRLRVLPAFEAGSVEAEMLAHSSPLIRPDVALVEPRDGPAPLCRLVFETPLAIALVAAVLALVELVPRGTLRQCLGEHRAGDPCARVYVAAKNQKFCPAHQQPEMQRLRQRLAEERFRERQRQAQAKKKAKAATKRRRTTR